MVDADGPSLLIAEATARGHSREEIIAELSTGMQESGWRMVWSPNGLWYGFFQQDASYPNRMVPLGNIRGFLDRLDVKRRSPGASSDPFKNIFWLQQRPSDPSADVAYERGRKAYYDEIRRHIAWATQKYEETMGERPDFNEFPIWSSNHSARSGYQEVREALEEIARLRALLREQLPDDPALDNDQHNRAPRSGDPG